MDYSLKLSLEYITLIKVVGSLWNRKDIRNLIEKFCTPFNSTELKNEWPKIEERVKAKVPQLALPVHLKEKIEDLIKPIGSEILRWMKYHGDTCFNVHLPGDFHWTSQGTIDEKKIAEMLIKDDTIDIFTHYKISCIYCLEDDILKLWNKIPEVCKKSFYSAEDPMRVKQPELVVLWTYDIKGEVSKMEPVIERKLQHRCSPYQYAFENAAKEGNKVALRYFLLKLTSAERRESLIRSAESVAFMRLDSSDKHTEFLYEYYSDILCILLTYMDDEQQEEIFRKFPYHVLNCFLDWPWQACFRKVFNHVWKFLPMKHYDSILADMISKVIKGYKDYDYRKLLTENWQAIPNAYKRSVFKEDVRGSYLMPKLFKIRDENNIRLIYKDATLTDKRNIFHCYGGGIIRKDLIDSEEWGLLKFFFQQCAFSKGEIKKLKKKFQKHEIETSSRDKREKMKNKWNIFLNLLDDLTYSSSERSVDESVDR